MLLVSGEPGIGKTRFTREVITQAEVSGGQVFVGECHPGGSAPYAAFAQVVRRILRKHTSNGLELPNVVMADMLELAPGLRSEFPDMKPNPKLDPEAEQLRLFESFVKLCSALIEESPLLLVLEDIHWSDSGSLRMFQHLARRTREMPVMVLGTYREVELDEALPFHEALLELNRQRIGTHIKLERLDRERVREMLGVIFAEEITDELLEGIFRETEGNPFFTEEVCKALVDSGEVWYENKEWHRPDDMSEMAIPQSVRVAVQSRVSKLTDETQEVLLNAAVIGREFDYQILWKVAGKDEDVLIDGLEEAMRAQLVEEVKGEGGEVLSFSHALIPASLREGVSGLRRSRLHKKVAAAIEDVHPEEYEQLAHHWGEGGNEERALEYTIKAANRARETYANEDAVRLYSDALAVMPEDAPERFELLESRVGVYDILANREAQFADVQEMMAMAEAQGDDAWLVDALFALVSYYLNTEEGEAREPAEKALEIARRMSDRAREGQALYLLG